jgi:DNA polymerase-1
MIMSQLLHAGTDVSHKLADVAVREVGKHLDKTEQTSDWSGTLTRSQLDYAAADVAVLVPLHKALDAKVRGAKLQAVAEIEHRCLPAMVWLAQAGVAFDKDAWSELARQAAADADRLAEELDAVAPPRNGHNPSGAARNWNSPAQVKDALHAAGCPVEKTDDDTLAKLDHPLAVLLRAYRTASKRTSTYGDKWLKHVANDGRVYASWHQIGKEEYPTIVTGRMACSDPNLQQVPRGEHRKCFRAPPGRVLVKADYSQIELRIAAKLTGDKALLAAYRNEDDIHVLTARQLTGKADVAKEDRQIAKAVNFGLLYGMGAKAFRAHARAKYGVELSLEQATAYRAAFFKAYPGLRAWHRRQPKRAVATRTLAGRRRLNVERFTEQLNTPVQGTGADGVKRALALLWERRAEVPGAFPLLVVHDEIVVECDAEDAEAVKAWLQQAMLDGIAGWLEPVPVEVEVKIVSTWGG